MQIRFLDIVFIILLGVLYYLQFKRNKKVNRHEDILKDSEV